MFDQQSSTNESPPFPGTGAVIQQVPQPWGQSFTPILSAIDFIRLKLSDNATNNGLGAVLRVNLRTDSVGGPILATTDPLALADGFAGTADFFFSASGPLTSNVFYYFEPIVVSGDLWKIDSGEYNYPGGSAWVNGLPGPGSDVWFREGIVPEPSSVWLALIGGGAFAFVRRGQRSERLASERNNEFNPVRHRVGESPSTLQGAAAQLT